MEIGGADRRGRRTESHWTAVTDPAYEKEMGEERIPSSSFNDGAREVIQRADSPSNALAERLYDTKSP